MASLLTLLSASLQKPLDDLILPKLDAAALTRLACTCSHMQNYLAAVNTTVWTSAAASVLYEGHPALSSASNTVIRQSIRIYVQSKRQMQQNVHSPLLDLPTARNLSMSPGGTRLAMISVEKPNGSTSGSAHLQVCQSDPTTSTLQLTFQIQLAAIHASRHLMMQLVWSDDTQFSFLCTAPGYLDCTVYDAGSGQQLSALLLPYNDLPCQISPNGRLFVHCSKDKIAVYDLRSQTGHSWGHRVSLRTLWSPDSLQIAYTHVLEDGRCRATNSIYRLGDGPQTGVGVLKAWEPNTWSKNGHYLACAKFSKHKRTDGSHKRSASPFKVFDMWSNATALELPSVYRSPGVVFSPNSLSLVTCRYAPHSSGTIEIWDIATASVMRTFSRDPDFRFAAFAPDSRYLAVGQASAIASLPKIQNSLVHICSIASGEAVTKLTCLAQAVQSAVWHPTQSSIFLQHHRGITAVSFDPAADTPEGLRGFVI